MRHGITRKAILIGCPGSGNSFLRGVAEDLTNMEIYLQSDKGGRWFPSEIVMLTNPSFEKVFSFL